MHSSIIELKGVSKSYHLKKKVVHALEDISFSLRLGGYMTLMGPSGCGKSTITKIISGIENADAGSLFIDGKDCTRGVPKAIKKRLGYVFQWHNLAEWKTVEGNLYLPLEIFGEKKDASWKQRADKYLEFVGLSDYRTVYPHELSGGMKQRVGIARALMNEPDILVFDQPFGALDAITRKQIAHTFSRHMHKEGKSVLIVSSNIDEAIQYSDQICFLTSGVGRVRKIVDIPFPYEDRQAEDFLLSNDFLDFKREMLQYIDSDSAHTPQKGGEEP